MMLHRAAAALRAASATSSRSAASTAARAIATSVQGAATSSANNNVVSRSFAESSEIAPSINQPRSNFSTSAAVEASDGSPWSDFPMAPPDPIIGLTEVRGYNRPL